MPNLPFRPTQQPGNSPVIVPNFNPKLRVLVVDLDQNLPYFENWEHHAIVGFVIDVATPYADAPICPTDTLEHDLWCLWDQSTNACYSAAGTHWIGALGLEEAKRTLADAARKEQAKLKPDNIAAGKS